jgi:hypothetical protein
MVFEPNPLAIFSAAISQKFFAIFNLPLKKDSQQLILPF